jgi:hypothetical protein
MRHVARVLLSSLAVTIFAAITASAALATTPEWFKGGQKIGTTHVSFTTESQSAPELESNVGNRILCTASRSSGEITGNTTIGKIVATYTGCHEGQTKCQNTATEGEIVTDELSATNIYVLNNLKTNAGERFKPASGTEFVKYECEGTTFTVEGEVIGEALPLGKEQATGEVIFEKSVGTQKYLGKEGKNEKVKLLAWNGQVESAIANRETVTFSTPVELHKS